MEESNFCPAPSCEDALQTATKRFDRLSELGYTHTWHQSPKNDTEFLTSVASKLPMRYCKYHELVSERVIVEVLFCLFC